MNYINLPKIDLHCHLDGSVRPKTIIDLARIHDVSLPEDEQAVIDLLVVPQDCKTLDDYLDCFKLPIMLMQTADAIERISYELFEDAAKENVKYLEVRFAPLLHTNKGLSVDEIINSAVKGMRKAEQAYDIHGNYILSVLRHMPKEGIYTVIDAGHKLLNNGVVAFDIAGSEQPGFCNEFIEHSQYAIEKGFRVTIHAGEQGCGQNVHDAISMLGAERIGHGVHITGNEAAYNLVKESATALEVCPISNVQTKCIEKLADHPVESFHKDGVIVTINTDNRTVSGTTMTDEVRRVFELFDLTDNDYVAIYKNSIESSFASDAVKTHLLTFID